MSSDLVPQDAEDFDQVYPEPFPLAEQAVVLYLESGSLADVGRKMHIPVQELYRASKTPWWIQEVALRKRMERAATDARMTKLLDKTLENIENVLTDGEDYFDQQGGKHKKKVPAMALARLADVLFDKRQVLRGLPTGNDETSRKLSKLAEQLENLGRAALAKPILDAEEVTPRPPGGSTASDSGGNGASQS